MSDTKPPLAVDAYSVPPRANQTGYPEPFASLVSGRTKRALGDVFGLTNFGVNLTVLEPGAMTALLHIHAVQDELVFVLDGAPTLVTDQGEMQLSPGMCTGFAANGIAHHIVNRTDRPVTILEIGDRLPGDSGTYPEDDLRAERGPDGWVFLRKDGTAY